MAGTYPSKDGLVRGVKVCIGHLSLSGDGSRLHPLTELESTGNLFRFPFGNFMGFFPTTVKNLGQEIPCMGKYWEVKNAVKWSFSFVFSA